MYGTIIGDIAGSYYEMFNIKTKKFKFMEKANPLLLMIQL